MNSEYMITYMSRMQTPFFVSALKEASAAYKRVACEGGSAALHVYRRRWRYTQLRCGINPDAGDGTEGWSPLRHKHKPKPGPSSRFVLFFSFYGERWRQDAPHPLAEIPLRSNIQEISRNLSLLKVGCGGFNARCLKKSNSAVRPGLGSVSLADFHLRADMPASAPGTSVKKKRSSRTALKKKALTVSGAQKDRRMPP